MSAVTPVEALPYPCLTDPFARHWIEDLAVAADTSLNRIRSDVDLVEKRAKCGLRRPSTTQLLASPGPSTVTYDTVDYDNTTPAWGSAATGLITPHLAGIYYVDANLTLTAIGGGQVDATTMEIQYNGVSQVVRRWSGGISVGGGP